MRNIFRGVVVVGLELFKKGLFQPRKRKDTREKENKPKPQVGQYSGVAENEESRSRKEVEVRAPRDGVRPHPD